MKIYVAHAFDYPDFRNELYKPLRKIKEVDFIFPYENNDVPSSTKNIIKGVNMMICDVSSQKLGTGIEIGWADAFGVPIIFIYKTGSKLSRSLDIVSNKFIEYNRVENILDEIGELICM